MPCLSVVSSRARVRDDVIAVPLGHDPALRGSPCSVVGDPCAYALNNTYIHTYIHAHKHQLYSTLYKVSRTDHGHDLPVATVPTTSCLLHSPSCALATLVSQTTADSNRHPCGKYHNHITRTSPQTCRSRLKQTPMVSTHVSPQICRLTRTPTMRDKIANAT